MAKLSAPMIDCLRAIRDAGEVGMVVSGPTLAALRRRYAVRPLIVAGDSVKRWTITPTGRAALDEIDRAEREAKEAAERKARPVPASAFVEPSARTAPVLGLEYEDEPDEDAPAVPQAWIDQLVTLLDAGARIVQGPQRWKVERVPDAIRSMLSPERVDMTVREAIRRGIAQALPPTPGQGVVRLALADKHALQPDPPPSNWDY